MGMDLVSDLKECRKEINSLINSLEKIQHKMGLMRDRLKAKGFTDKQLSDIQDIWDELLGV